MAGQEQLLQKTLSRREFGKAALAGGVLALLPQFAQRVEGAVPEAPHDPFVDLDIGKEQFDSPLVYPLDATGFLKAGWSPVDTLLSASMNPADTTSPYALSVATYEKDGAFSPFIESLDFEASVHTIDTFVVTGSRSVVMTGAETHFDRPPRPIIGKIVLGEQPTVSYFDLPSDEIGAFMSGVSLPDDPEKLLYVYLDFRGVNLLNPSLSDVRFDFRIFDQQNGAYQASESMTAAHLPDVVYRSGKGTIVTIGRGMEIVGGDEGIAVGKPRRTEIDPKTGMVVRSDPFRPLSSRLIDALVLDTMKPSPRLHAFSSEGGQGILTTVDLDHPGAVRNISYTAELTKLFDRPNDKSWLPFVFLTAGTAVGDTLWTAGVYGQETLQNNELLPDIGMIFAPFTLDSNGFVRGVQKEEVVRIPMPHGAAVPPFVKKLDLAFFPSANPQERLGTPGLLADVDSYGFVFFPLDEKEIVYPNSGLPRMEMETPPENKTPQLRLEHMRRELDKRFTKKPIMTILNASRLFN